MKQQKINILHLVFTLVITITSLVLLTVLLYILEVVLTDPLHTTPAAGWTHLLLIDCAVLALALLLLLRLRRKARTAGSVKALSYTAAAWVSVALFLCAAYTPLASLIGAKPADALTPQQEKDAQKEEQLIEQFIRESTFNDSLSGGQVKRITDSLENTWKADTISK